MLTDLETGIALLREEGAGFVADRAEQQLRQLTEVAKAVSSGDCVCAAQSECSGYKDTCLTCKARAAIADHEGA